MVEALEADTGALHDDTDSYRPGALIPRRATPRRPTRTPTIIWQKLREPTPSGGSRARSRRSLIDSSVTRAPEQQSFTVAAVTAKAPNAPATPRNAPLPGEPILQVDHVQDLAKGGAELPSNMIALYPNCHTLKTYGANRDKLRRLLAATVRHLHAKALG